MRAVGTSLSLRSVIVPARAVYATGWPPMTAVCCVTASAASPSLASGGGAAEACACGARGGAATAGTIDPASAQNNRRTTRYFIARSPSRLGVESSYGRGVAAFDDPPFYFERRREFAV